ncbi:hypothetical protein FisN_26Hu140 [Fistulifera solaris]|uniref:Uncharacterized protein n=1 Tax=Fistulifera solaris TaxID=1519565 RepID=A0A1Z5JYF0_FISSO|nr:hypothetical protein FisN_26Hu140 [Fistulifera solaris]|eukprot:GAX18838.1 hypothetical protein FisN_26Hu140 [Fistulifera solaris]
MSNEFEVHGLLLRLIPPSLCKPEQKAQWEDDEGEESSTYTLLRKPTSLQEFNPYKQLAVWRENETLTYVVPFGGNSPHLSCEDRKSLTIELGKASPTLYIVGETEDAIVDTAAFFMSFHNWKDSIFHVSTIEDRFYFSGDRSSSSAQLFERISASEIRLTDLSLTAAQSTVLATKPYRISLTLDDCVFEDEGTAFVNALAKRTSSFGSLTFNGQGDDDEDQFGLSRDNLERLLQVKVLEHFGSPMIHEAELALDALCAKVKSVECGIFITYLDPNLLVNGLEGFDIVAENLALSFENEYQGGFPTKTLLAFFRHLGKLGHFKKIKFRFDFKPEVMKIPESIVQELIRTVFANRNLEVLDLTAKRGDLEWDAHLETLLDGLKDHSALRTLKINGSYDAFGRDFSYIRNLISHNRSITVMDKDERIHGDRYGIPAIYSLNRFYCGSKALVVEPPSERAPLVATALLQKCRFSLKRSALLLSDNTDALLDLIQAVPLDECEEALSTAYQVPKRPRRA